MATKPGDGPKMSAVSTAAGYVFLHLAFSGQLRDGQPAQEGFETLIEKDVVVTVDQVSTAKISHQGREP